MADDLKPHQRLVELPWQARVRSDLEIRDGMAMAALGVTLKAGRTYHIAAPAKPRPITPAKAKKAAHRAKVKAARKQKHGGKR